MASLEISPLSVGILVGIDVYCRDRVGSRSDEWLQMLNRCFDPRVAKFGDLYSALQQFDGKNPEAMYTWLFKIWEIQNEQDLAGYLRTVHVYASPPPESAIVHSIGQNSIFGRWCVEISQYYWGPQELSILYEELSNLRSCTMPVYLSSDYTVFAEELRSNLKDNSPVVVADAIERLLAPGDPLSELRPAELSDGSRVIEAKLQQNDTAGAVRAAHAKFSRLTPEKHPYAMLKLAEISTQAGNFAQSAKYLMEAISLARRQGNDLLVVIATLSLYSLSIDFPESVSGVVEDRNSLWAFLDSGANKQIFAENFPARLLLKQLSFQQSVLGAAPRHIVKERFEECEQVFFSGDKDCLEAQVSYRTMFAFHEFMRAETQMLNVNIALIDLLQGERGLSTKMAMDLFVDKVILLGFSLDLTDQALELVESQRYLIAQDKSVAETWSLVKRILLSQKAVKEERFGDAMVYLQECEKFKKPPSAGLLASVHGMIKLRFLLAIDKAEVAYEHFSAKHRENAAGSTGHMAFVLINLSAAIRALAQLSQQDITAYELGSESLMQFEELAQNHYQEIAELQVKVSRVLLFKAANKLVDAVKCSQELVAGLSGTRWPYILSEVYLIHAQVLDAACEQEIVTRDARDDAVNSARYLLEDRFKPCGFVSLRRQLDILTKN